ncbi:MAG: hypothetical protein ACI8ZX_002124 [Planctomycetota bacterium]|jgi:hypothetical protein
MIMKTKYIGIIIIVIGLMNSCAKPIEDIYSTELKFPEFINVEIINAANVTIEYGAEQRIIVTGNDFAIKNVVTEVIAETLIIDKEQEGSEELYYQIFTPFIREVKNSSTGSVEILDFEQEGYLSLISTNTGNINLGKFHNVSLLTVAIENEGSVYGIGTFDFLKDLHVKVSGSGEYNGFLIEAKNVIAEIDGTGSCSVYVIEELNATITGSGSVFYKGNPTSVVSYITGSGSVVKVN